MPILILSTSDTPDLGYFSSEVQLQPVRTFGVFRSFVELGRPTLMSFSSVVQLQRAETLGRLSSRVLLLPAGSSLADMPLTPVMGGAPVDISVGCVLGKALKFDYEHSGEDESATLTIRKARHQVPDTLVLTVARQGVPQFAANLTVHPRNWEEVTEGEVTTSTIQLFNETAYRARTRPLPELVSWHLAPRSDTDVQGFPPRSVSVTGLIRQAAAAVGIGFAVIGNDPFEGETWLEGRRDNSTEGKTFTAVASEVYGSTHRLIVRGRTLLAVPHGQNVSETPWMTFPPCAVTRLTRRGEAGNLPGQLRLTASDALIPKPVIEEQTPQEATPETDAKQSWLTHSFSDGVETISAGYVQGGLLRQTQEITRGNVTVAEKVDDKDVTVTYSGVLIGAVRTDFVYHESNPEALVAQTTTKQNYGYGLNTKIEPRGLSGVMFGGFLNGGDLVSEETEQVVQSWYESGELAGYQQQRVVTTRRLISLGQQDSEAEPKDRGPLTGRDYATLVRTDHYRRIGRMWSHQWNTTGGTNLPVFDSETDEAVRLAQKVGPIENGTEVMQNDPPKVDWPAIDAVNPDSVTEAAVDEIAVPQRMAFAVREGGEVIVQQDFSMLADTTKLPALALLVSAANSPRIVTELELMSAFDALPGAGNVTNLHISMEGKRFSSSVTREEIEVLGVSAVPWPEPAEQFGVVNSVSERTVTLSHYKNGAWQESKAMLPKGMTVTPGTTVAHRLNSQGVNMIVNGVK